MLKSMRFNVAYLLIAVLGVFLVHDAWVANQTVASIPYSEFQRLLREKKVKEVVITAQPGLRRADGSRERPFEVRGGAGRCRAVTGTRPARRQVRRARREHPARS